MAFCTQCGNQIGDTDHFCTKCGRGQGAHAAETGPPSSTSQFTVPMAHGGIRPNVAALMCYIPELGWIASAIFLTMEPYKSNRYIRFHAFQGLFLQVANLLVRVIFFPIPLPFYPFSHWTIRRMLQLVLVIAQVVGIIKTAKHEDYRLPVVGELAEKSLA